MEDDQTNGVHVHAAVRSEDRAAECLSQRRAQTFIAPKHFMVDSVAIEHARVLFLERAQKARLPRARAAGDADDDLAVVRVLHMEARGLFEAVADGKAKAFTVRTLCPDLAHIRLVERPQRVEDMLRLRALIAARAEGVNDVPCKERHELIKADHARVLRCMGQKIARARLRPTGNDRDGGLGRVVAVFHAGGTRLFAVIHLLRHGFVNRHLAQRVNKAFQRQSARAQELRRRNREIDDRRLDAHLAGASVHDAVDLPPHILAHVLRRCAAGAARGVSARRGDGHARLFDDGARHRMVGTSHADRLKSARRAQRHAGLFLQDHRQRAGPEALGQPVGRVRYILAVAREPAYVGNVQNEGVVLRAALGFENMQHGIFVKSVRTEAVHRLRRDRQKPPAAQDIRRLRDALFILHRAEGKPFCFQCSLFFLKLRCSRAAFPPAPASSARR